jgi:ankyrin repeat protein
MCSDKVASFFQEKNSMDDAQALFESIRIGDAGKVRELVGANATLVNARNPQLQSAVLMSCYQGRKEIRDLLIEKGATLELHEAAAAGNLVRVQEIVDSDPGLAKSYSPDGFPVLALAAVFGHEHVARYLHGRGSEINAIATNGTGYSALTGAVASGHASIARWLAENGADVNCRYAKGYSPLLTAAANGHLEIVKILLAHGADLHAHTDDGKDALAFAQERGHKEVAKYLLEVGLTP